MLINKDLQLQAYKLLAESLGFELSPLPGGNISFRHSRANLCQCGKAHPVIEEEILNPGKWLARCPECFTRTIAAGNPLQAVRNWNTQRFTRNSRLTMHKLTKDDLSNEGVDNLICALKIDAARELVQAKKRNMLHSKAARDAAWFLNNESLVRTILKGDTNALRGKRADRRQDPGDH